MISKKREKLLTLAAIVVIALLAGDKLVLSPLTGLWRKRSARIEELTRSLNTGRSLLEPEREKSIRDRWEFMRANALPADPSEAEALVLKAVDRWVRASRLNIVSSKQQWKLDSRDEDLVTLECRADGTGEMQAVARFLYELEKDPLALKIEDLEVTARDDKGQQLALGVRFSGLKLSTDQR